MSRRVVPERRTMVRTTLAVILSTMLMTVSARAEELAPTTATLTAAGELTDAPSIAFRAAAGERRPAALSSMYAGLAALQGYDVYSTMVALKRGATEANPLMAGVTRNPGAFIALKAGMTTVSIVAAERLWRQHHRAQAVAVMAISNGFMALVAAHNASVVATAR